ncbi:pyridoxal phosphate-dependent aminotransferase [Streptomyces sp. NPDC002659]|uniref:pyridoxal phosphate-dependent aminotransferase n=1 Tax=Streptomyces sp. NPDC002659 TaxID=3364656 RepID=UPI0036832EFD
MISKEILQDLLMLDDSAGGMPDAQLLRDYLTSGMPHGEPICMSLGGTWDRIAPGLAEFLSDTPKSAHGYQLSLHGLPRLRTALAEHLRSVHRIPDSAARGRDWDVAVAWTGTRSAMFDFGRLVKDRCQRPGRRPVVLIAGPAWDYAGVFSPLGYQIRYLPLRSTEGFLPNAAELDRIVAQIDADPAAQLALVVVNAQHNPTAVNWSSGFVAQMLAVAGCAGAGVLIDDAYFNVHDEGVKPTSALKMMIEAGSLGFGAPWLAVQSMGKQFGSSGWGIGSLIASVETLDALVHTYRLHHTLMSSGMLQHAMADWLQSPDCAHFLARQRVQLTETRATAEAQFVKRLGYPGSAVHVGECTPYIVVDVPPAYAESEDTAHEFRTRCFERTGVLTAPIWPWPMPKPEAAQPPQLRLYLGSGISGVREAVRRMADAGLVYSAVRSSEVRE